MVWFVGVASVEKQGTPLGSTHGGPRVDICSSAEQQVHDVCPAVRGSDMQRCETDL